MNAAATRTTLALIDTAPTERDWHARAWQRLSKGGLGLRHPNLNLDGALAHPVIGKVVRGLAATLRREAAELAEREARQQRYGVRVHANRPGWRGRRA